MKGYPVNFVAVGTRYAFRRLEILPKVGEFVRLKLPKGSTKDFEVIKVIHDVSDDNENHWQVYVWVE